MELFIWLSWWVGSNPPLVSGKLTKCGGCLPPFAVGTTLLSSLSGDGREAVDHRRRNGRERNRSLRRNRLMGEEGTGEGYPL